MGDKMFEEMRLLRTSVEQLNARLSKWEGTMEALNRKEQNALRRQHTGKRNSGASRACCRFRRNAFSNFGISG